MPLPAAVLDANVIISGLGFFGAPRHCIDLAIDGNAGLITCRTILDDVRAKLVDKLGFPAEHAGWAVDKITAVARVVDPPGQLRGVCRDPDDDVILECALVGEADYLVTGDRDLLVLTVYQSVRIVNPKDFIAALSGS